MNQRVEAIGAGIQGSVLTNKYIVPGSSSWNNLIGYYKLFPNEIVSNETIDISATPVNGVLKNIETNQYNSAPLPYISEGNGDWTSRSTWDQNIGNAQENWWSYPNDKGINGTDIQWNIAKISHTIDSKANDIYLLGLLSESNTLTMTGDNNTATGQALTISHYLNLNGIIDLDGESQLVQTTGSILEETSLGYLERDQQGTANSFNYNYWTSPVSIQGTGNNSGYKIGEVLNDGTDPQIPGPISFDYWYEYADYTYSGPKHISSYWFYTFNGDADTYVQWSQVSELDLLPAGIGYTMKGTMGWANVQDYQNYTFRGKPNNGDITLQISSGSNLLIGNPYPSAIDGTKFIDDNLGAFNGSIYLWDHFGPENSHYLADYVGGYAITNKAGEVRAISTDERINSNDEISNKYPGRYIPVGQAFFISTVQDVNGSGTSSGGTVKFTNGQRVFVTEANKADSQFLSHENPRKAFKSTYSKDNRFKIRLHYRGPKGYHREILVTADELTTNNFDLGYDAPLIEDNLEDMYWLINESEFVIQAVPNFDKEQVLPLGIRVGEAGEFSIEIENLENLDKSFNIYVHDKENGTYHNLSKNEFKAEAEEGEFNDLFEIVFAKPGEVAVDETDEEVIEVPVEEILIGTQFNIDYLRESKVLILENPDLLKIERVELYSLNGQSLGVFENTPVQEVINLTIEKTLSSAVYIVKVFSEKGQYSKKIIINR
ncbi:T9SS type A sorting domain-containing protein [Christiangramia antarctica]|uniref:T9SS type A sorting domain-containing protein n=2 Tax=Christiangramia TaxID=292691 RepID=A0ABW5X632_9FLAO